MKEYFPDTLNDQSWEYRQEIQFKDPRLNGLLHRMGISKCARNDHAETIIELGKLWGQATDHEIQRFKVFGTGNAGETRKERV